ncbi:hypothetical protein QOT17_006027, partial [Balamuthia mandrillaris]
YPQFLFPLAYSSFLLGILLPPLSSLFFPGVLFVSNKERGMVRKQGVFAADSTLSKKAKESVAICHFLPPFGYPKFFHSFLFSLFSRDIYIQSTHFGPHPFFM